MSEGRQRSFFVSGGTLPPDSASYIERSTDRLLLESLLAGRFCYVLNSRQLGKSSLSVHTISRLEEMNVRTAFVDLTRIGGKNVTAEQWYSGIALEIARGLNCRREAVAYWKEHDQVAFVQRLFGMISDVALDPSRGEAPLVIFIDEIDATRSLPFDADEFFAAIRECYNRRVSEPVFEKLTFCLLGVAVPSDLVRNRAMTPFNIGERITLEDFTVEELSAFAPELGPKGKEVVDRVHYWTSGHPFLSQTLCRTISGQEGIDDPRKVDEIVQRELFDFKARDSNINLADVANIALHYGDNEPDPDAFRANLLSVYERVLHGREVFDDESNREVVLLKLSGIVRTDGRRLQLRNRIYQKVFDRKWIEEHMPEQELRRQRQSYRRGVWRTAIIASSILAVVGVVAAMAWYSRIKAAQAEERLNYELYVADMNSLRHFYDNGDTGRIETILNRHKNSPYRGFEWGYWLGRYHDSSEEYTVDYKAPGKRVEGHISTDGTEICIVDLLSLTATIVDRKSKRRIAASRIASAQLVTPLRSRWAWIDAPDPFHYRVMDVKTGLPVSTLGDSNHRMQWISLVAHGDLVATGEVDRDKPNLRFINLWSAETGRKVFGIPSPWENGPPQPWLSQDPFAFSADGKLIAYERGPIGTKPVDPSDTVEGEVIIAELESGKIVDRFKTDNYNDIGSKGFQKRWVLFQNRGRFYIRDIEKHKSIDWRPDMLGDWQLLDAMLIGDSLVARLNGGRCVIHDLTGKKRDVLRENVFAIAPGAKEGQYLASSNTVRIYDSSSPAVSSVIASGRRVTRYSPGILNIYSSSEPAISRITENDYRVVGTVPKVGDSGAYTYSGRWYLVKSDKDQTSTLTEVEGRVPPIKLPFWPSIWSAGHSASSIVLWSFSGRRLAAYSGTDNRIRWTRTDLPSINSLWVSPDGKKLFAGWKEREIIVLDMADGHTLGKMNVHNFGPVNLTFTADNRKVFTCGGDGAAVLWDAETLEQIREFRGNDQEGMTSADISLDGRRVVTTTRSGSWQLWDASNGVQLLDVHVSAVPLLSAIFVSNGKEILTAGEDEQVRIWRSVNVDPTTYVPIDHAYLKGLHR